MEKIIQDIRYSIRKLLKSPGFTIAALITLALGIGANTAIFSVVNSVLLRPQPFKDPNRIVFVWETSPQGQITVSLPDFLDWQKHNQVFENLASYAYDRYNLTGSGQPEQVRGVIVSGEFFDLLGVEPILGRTLRPEEDRERFIVLSHGLWQRRFGSNPNIIGQSLLMDNVSWTVKGVMPASFQFPSTEAQLWTSFVPIYSWTPAQQSNRKRHIFRVIGRIKQGVTTERAQGEMTTLAAGLEQENPDSNAGVGVKLVSVDEQLVGAVRPALLILVGAVGLVLLIACVNVANLLLARASGREREIAVRTALGATRSLIIRQMLTESMLVALAGGAIGLLLGIWGVKVLVSLSPGNIPRLETSTLDSTLLLFTIGISLLTGLIFGLIPALQATKLNLSESLREGGRGTAGSIRSRRVQNLLVVSEIALSLVLLIGAGLLSKSFLRLLDTDAGFNPDNVITVNLIIPTYKYPKSEQRASVYRQIIDRVSVLPGVQTASVSDSLPPHEGETTEPFTIEKNGTPDSEESGRADYLPISPNFFRSLKIPVLKGREFTEADNATSPDVVIINEHLAHRYYGDVDPVGQRLGIGNKESMTWYSIIGVVGDVKYQGLDSETDSSMYFSYTQVSLGGLYLVVRTDSDPRGLLASVRNEIWAVDPDLPALNVKTMNDIMSDVVAQPRFNTLLIGIFAAISLVLAAVGIYGVIAYSVTQRTNEIGIRMALGAQRSDVLKLIVKQGLKLAIVGVVIGLTAAFAATRIISGLLYGVSATDMSTFGIAALLLVGVALAASYLPARRATKVDPMIALRNQ